MGPTKAIAFSDPVALPLLSTGKIDLLSVGSEHTRVEKTLRTAEVATSHQSLDVCVREDQTGNCSNCWKCRRTLLTLEIGGFLEQYSSVFDLSVYRAGRTRHIARLIQSDEPLAREIVSFARERNFAFPLSSQVVGYVVRRAKRLLRRRTLRDRMGT